MEAWLCAGRGLAAQPSPRAPGSEVTGSHSPRAQRRCWPDPQRPCLPQPQGLQPVKGTLDQAPEKPLVAGGRPELRVRTLGVNGSSAWSLGEARTGVWRASPAHRDGDRGALGQMSPTLCGVWLDQASPLPVESPGYGPVCLGLRKGSPPTHRRGVSERPGAALPTSPRLEQPAGRGGWPAGRLVRALATLVLAWVRGRRPRGGQPSVFSW